MVLSRLQRGDGVRRNRAAVDARESKHCHKSGVAGDNEEPDEDHGWAIAPKREVRSAIMMSQRGVRPVSTG
jgi:hypothetical protein